MTGNSRNVLAYPESKARGLKGFAAMPSEPAPKQPGMTWTDFSR